MSKANILSTPKTPPTSFLPSLKQLRTIPATQISLALNTLRSLYFPPALPPLPKNIVIPKRFTSTLYNLNGLSSVPDSGYASATGDRDDTDEEGEAWERPERDEEKETQLDRLQADDFERAFAIKWLTGFISRYGVWDEPAGEDEDDGIVVEVEGETKSRLATNCQELVRRSKLIEDATTILSLFSNDEDKSDSSLNLIRSFTFPTPTNQHIKIELNDEPMSSRDHTSVGLQSWASSILLAGRIASSPSTFLYHLSPFDNGKTLRILELGAGTGLSSIVAAKILQNESANGKPIANIIVATDYHPDVLENLKKNVQANFADTSTRLLLPSSSSARSDSSLPIEVNYLDWANPHSGSPLNTRFDVILAADVIYHPDHAPWIKNCVEKYLELPTQSRAGGIFWLMIAVRTTGRHEGLDVTVDECFREEISDGLGLIILERKDVVKQGGYGRADEGGYRLFKISWKPTSMTLSCAL